MLLSRVVSSELFMRGGGFHPKSPGTAHVAPSGRVVPHVEFHCNTWDLSTLSSTWHTTYVQDALWGGVHVQTKRKAGLHSSGLFSLFCVRRFLSRRALVCAREDAFPSPESAVAVSSLARFCGLGVSSVGQDVTAVVLFSTPLADVVVCAGLSRGCVCVWSFAFFTLSFVLLCQARALFDCWGVRLLPAGHGEEEPQRVGCRCRRHQGW